MKPRWRWLLWCIGMELSWRFNWKWAGNLMVWASLPEWFGKGTKMGDEVPW